MSPPEPDRASRPDKLGRALVLASPLTAGTGVDGYWQRLRDTGLGNWELIFASEHDRNGEVRVPKLGVNWESSRWARTKLPLILEANRIDVVISSISQTDILLAHARRKLGGRPWIILISGQPYPVRGQTHWLKRLIWKWLWNRSARSADGWVAVSQATAARYSPDRDRTTIVRPLAPQIAPAHVCEQQTGVVGFVGRLSEEKDPNLFARIVTADPPLPHAMFGSGQLSDQLKDAHPRLNLRGFAPARTAFGQIDILILTSRSEGLPLVVLEAAQFGIPILAADVGGVMEAIHPELRELLLVENQQRNNISLWRQRVDQLREPPVRSRVIALQQDWVSKEFGATKNVSALVMELCGASRGGNTDA